MSDPSLDQLTEPLTLDDVRNGIYGVLTATGVTTTNWKPGAVIRTIITGCALVIAALSRMVALIVRAGWASTSSGPWLALCALYTFGVQKLVAGFASGTITLTNTGGGVYGPLAPGELIVASSVSGKTYYNTATVNIASLQVQDIAVSAHEAGSASTANPGDISVLVTALGGITCNNSTALIGTDDEADPALQQRCQEKLGALSPNGPADAYAYVAKSAGRDVNGNPVLITATQPGSPIGINRVTVVRDGFGGLDCYVATATGGVTGIVGDTDTDLGAVDELLQVYATPLAATLRTFSAVPRVLNVNFSIWLYQTSLTDTQITQAITAALAAYMPLRPIGGDVILGVGAVYVSALEAIIGTAQAAPGTALGIFKIDMGTTTDVVLAGNEVPVLGTTTATAIYRIKRAGT